MTWLYPHLLWMLLPLIALLWKAPRHATHVVHLIVLMLLLLALARPVQEHALQEASIEAKDIVIALDVSYSMNATDLMPTRYDFAKKTIRALLKNNPNDNIMLVAFTSNPLLLSPPTTDHTLIDVALQSLNPQYILTKGTSLHALFTKLISMNVVQKHLIILSDGGEEKNLEALSTLLVSSGAFVNIVALGSRKGATLMSKEGHTLKDKEGNLVISRINPLLEKLAQRANGNYLTTSSSPEATAHRLDTYLRQAHTKAQPIQKMQYHYKEWYALPLFLALILFFLVHTRGIKMILVCFALLGLPLEASVFDLYHLQHAYKSYENHDYAKVHKTLQKIQTPTLQSQILLAHNYYRQAQYKQSIGVYKSIRSTSASIKHMLYYNIANAYANMQAYDKAKTYYTKALQLHLDEDASNNLALIALLHTKEEASLGIAHPKSQSDASSQAEKKEDTDKNEQEEDTPSSGSGGGGESSAKEKQKESTLRSDNSEDDTPHPLGSKVYELINKGYIRETQPW